MKNPNKKSNELKFDNLTKERISLSKSGIGMYAITFTIGQRKISQTRHMTEAQAERYQPSVEVTYSGGRTLQKSSFDTRAQTNK